MEQTVYHHADLRFRLQDEREDARLAEEQQGPLDDEYHEPNEQDEK